MRLEVRDLGLIDFETAYEEQKRLLFGVKNNSLQSALLVCRHYPVITLGRSAAKNNILAPGEELEKRGIKVVQVERGGDVTYHGPGQLTLYPILNMSYFRKDIHWFLRRLEDFVIDWLADFAIKGVRRPGLTGAWVDNRKIASIGIAIKHWITFHGISINVKKDDLKNFSLIRPCGMDIKMTSLETESGREMIMDEIKEKLVYQFTEVFYGQGSLAGIR